MRASKANSGFVLTSSGVRSMGTHQSPAVQLMQIQQGHDHRLPNTYMKPAEEWDYLGPMPPGTLVSSEIWSGP